MGDRITSGVNPGLLGVQIPVLLIFAVCVHSGQMSSLSCQTVLCYFVFGNNLKTFTR